MKALLSIHDVMPHTRSRIDALLALVRRLAPGLAPDAVTLLVVPGMDWSDDDLLWLRSLQEQGYVLAGHGWVHQCAEPVSLYHRLHSAVISKNVAEHLSLDALACEDLVRRCHARFEIMGLLPPFLYVPPAWAMGGLSAAALARLPFRQYESLSGVRDVRRKRFMRLPLAGFEADTPRRALLVRLFNGWNQFRALQRNVPLRISLHPFDPELCMADDIGRLLANVVEFVRYEDLFSSAVGGGQQEGRAGNRSVFQARQLPVVDRAK